MLTQEQTRKAFEAMVTMLKRLDEEVDGQGNEFPIYFVAIQDQGTYQRFITVDKVVDHDIDQGFRLTQDEQDVREVEFADELATVNDLMEMLR